MFRNLSPYGDTRPTTLPWASMLPRHWRIERAKTVMRTVDVRSAAGEEELLTVSSKRGVVPRASAKVSMFRAESYVGHKLCWPDDLVINSLWAWGRGLGVARHHGIVSTAYGVYRQRKADLDPSYLNELVRSEPFQWELQVRSQGVWKSRLQISDERWLDAPLLVPPAEEQAAIVKYLDHANARIDKAIAAKRRLVALLREEATAASRVIFAELNAPILRAKDACLRIIDCKNRTPDYVEGGGFHVIRTTCVRAGKFSMEGSYPTDAENFATWTQRGVPEFGDVFFTREAPAGEAALVPAGIDVCLGQRMMLYRPDPLKIRSEYLMHAIYDEPARRFISLATNGSTVGHLRVGDIGAIPVRVPELSVQDEVLRKIRHIVSTTAQAVDRIEREIALLREFRARLVADVVTGQVDVRAIAATLPDVPESFDNTVSATDDDLEEALSEGEE